MDDITRKIQTLGDTSKHIQFQVTTTKTAFKINDKNEEQLQTALKDTLDEHSQLQGSTKPVSQETEDWKRATKLIKRKKYIRKA